MDPAAGRVEVVFEARAVTGEGPCWDAARARLLFVDIPAGRLYRLEPTTGAVESREIGRPVGAVVPRAGGGYALAVEDGIAFLDDWDGPLRMVVPMGAPGFRLNDAKCDPAGRLFAGTMTYDLSPGAAALYRIDGRWATPVVEGVTLSNGLDWSPAGDRMYYIDSLARSVDAFDYDPAAGALADRRRLVVFDQDDGLPDGMCVDAEGALWVAMWGGGCVRRFDPQGAEIGRVDLPVSQPSSCCFGGAALEDLYITSATAGLSEAQLRGEPLAGALFRIRPGVAGLPAAPLTVLA